MKTKREKLVHRAEAAARLARMHLRRAGIPPHRVAADPDVTFGGSVRIGVLARGEIVGGIFDTALCAKRIARECEKIAQAVEASK